MVRVLPVPAPARMHTGPDTACAAVRCSSSRPSSTVCAASTYPATAAVCAIPRFLPCSTEDRSSQPGTTTPGKHPRGRSVPSLAVVNHTHPGVDAPALTMEDAFDDCLTRCRDHVQHHVVRLLPSAQAAH